MNITAMSIYEYDDIFKNNKLLSSNDTLTNDMDQMNINGNEKINLNNEENGFDEWTANSFKNIFDKNIKLPVDKEIKRREQNEIISNSKDSDYEENKENKQNKNIFKVIKKKKTKKLKSGNTKLNRSLEEIFKNINTKLNIYLKGKLESKPELIKISFKGKNCSSKSLYINKDFTQKNLSKEEHSKKLKQKLSKYIMDKKIKKVKDNGKGYIIEKTYYELIVEFFDWIYAHLDLVKESTDFVELNKSFKKVTKYPLVNLEYDEGKGKKENGYLKYFSFNDFVD